MGRLLSRSLEEVETLISPLFPVPNVELSSVLPQGLFFMHVAYGRSPSVALCKSVCVVLLLL